MTQLTSIVGIGEIYATRVLAAGIETLGQLLEAGSDPNHRKDLAEKTGIVSGKILGWVKRIDPFHVIDKKGKYIKLLKAAGVDSISKLISYDPLDLVELLVEVNQGKKFVKKPPSPRRVEELIKAAGNLPTIIK